MDLEILVLERLELGRRRYGHGVRVDDDTRQFGTPADSWLHMANEEHIDAIIYLLADYIKKNDTPRTSDEDDDNQRILYYLMNPEEVKGVHNSMLSFLKKVINLNLSELETDFVLSTQEPSTTV